MTDLLSLKKLDKAVVKEGWRLFRLDQKFDAEGRRVAAQPALNDVAWLAPTSPTTRANDASERRGRGQLRPHGSQRGARWGGRTELLLGSKLVERWLAQQLDQQLGQAAGALVLVLAGLTRERPSRCPLGSHPTAC